MSTKSRARRATPRNRSENTPPDSATVFAQLLRGFRLAGWHDLQDDKVPPGFSAGFVMVLPDEPAPGDQEERPAAYAFSVLALHPLPVLVVAVRPDHAVADALALLSFARAAPPLADNDLRDITRDPPPVGWRDGCRMYCLAGLAPDGLWVSFDTQGQASAEFPPELPLANLGGETPSPVGALKKAGATTHCPGSV